MSERYQYNIINGQVRSADTQLKPQVSVPCGATAQESEAIRKSLKSFDKETSPSAYMEIIPKPFHEQTYDSKAVESRAAQIKAESQRAHDREVARQKAAGII